MDEVIKQLEKFLIWSIIFILTIILILAFADVIYEIVQSVIEPPLFIVDAQGLMELFSMFLIILIGLELVETVKAYLKDDVVHVELVIVVAIIAIARKVIIWDFDKYSTNELYGLGVMVVALGITYFLIKKAGFSIHVNKKKKKDSNTD
jgi:uncharacterized membrane protein (DUF373 family)